MMMKSAENLLKHFTLVFLTLVLFCAGCAHRNGARISSNTSEALLPPAVLLPDAEAPLAQIPREHRQARIGLKALQRGW